MIQCRKSFNALSIYFMLSVPIVLGSCEQRKASDAKVPPNIVLIVTDDQGWGDLGVNGNQQLQTPNIDKLARDGVQFSRFYVSPVCSPTRAEILTGRYHPRGGVYSTSQGGERLDLDEKTIADVFKSNGYETGAFGKWHNGSQGPFHPNSRGFDEFYGFCSGHWGNYFSPMLERNTEVVKGDGFIIDDLTSKALQFMEQNQTASFFTYLAYNTPHSPMQVPDKWWDKYKDLEMDSTHRYSSKEKVEKTKAALALCENIDHNVGRIVNKLDSLRLLDNTIIIYMSDNGPNGWRWNDGLKGIKGHTDEGGVRSPFIMHWKGQLTPRKTEQVASAIDILPTLTDLADIQNGAGKPLDGISLKPVLNGLDDLLEDRNVFSHWNGKVSVRNQRYMMDDANNLFDLLEDPGQMQPIDDATNSVRAALLSAKQEWMNTVLQELDREREEVFPVGYEGSRYTQLPARDGVPHGDIVRSNRWPNSSFFTNWKAETDSITWDCDILNEGNYQATVYYTCKDLAVGGVLALRQGKNEVQTTITEAHDPPFIGVEFDRFKREESFEKEFKALNIGSLKLEKGLHPLSLTASQIKEEQFIDVRLLVLERIN